jgi:hypothetical protein
VAKLPPEYVKAPAGAGVAAGRVVAPRVRVPAPEPAPERKRKARRTTLMTAERARDLLREVILRLGDDEHRELERAREELRRSGEEVTLEQMVHRVIAEWCLRRAAERSAAAAGPVDGIVAQLRRLAASPLRRWRDLGAALRRLAPALLT